MMTNGNGNGNGHHRVAVWAGLTTFFTNLAAINILALVGEEGNKGAQALAALITAMLVALSIYAKVRWDDAKEEKQRKLEARRQNEQ